MFQEIERAGGAWAALEAELIQRKVASVRTKRLNAIAHGTDALIFWALEGRAIQDVIVAPRREARRADRWKMGEYGTTIRFYRPADDTWDITFISPPNDQVHRLVGRKVGHEIVLEGTTPDGRAERWRFYDIAADRCRWRGELALADGSWFVEEEMILTRRSP